MKDIRKYVKESDLLVYATPIYWYGPSGQMKVVMDRCIAFLDENYHSRVKGKKAVTLLSCADNTPDTCKPTREMFERTLASLGIDYAGSIEATGCVEKGCVEKETLEAVRRLAQSVL
jgi:multimeric flavodoxin WrbA